MRSRREIFASALSSLNVMAAEAAHVGDSMQMDIRGAQDAGLHPILIDMGTIDAASIEPGVARVSSLAETIEVMRLLRFT